MKKSLLMVCAVLLGYATLELLSFLILAGVNSRNTNVFAASVTRHFSRLESSDLETFRAGLYDPLLGWDNKPDTSRTETNCLGMKWTKSYDSDGSRSMPESYASTLIATYGDSYAEGGEVNNDQTWQYLLSKEIHQGVKNFAVGGFGSYQALLKAKRHIEQGRIYPITILAINEENVRRDLNLFRPFLSRRVRLKLGFKPGLYCKDGGCTPIDNLLQPGVRTVEEARHLAGEAKRWDYWARHKPAFEYPWTLNLVKLVRWEATDGMVDEGEPLWRRPEGIAAMHFVVSEFREVVENAGSKPVILFVVHRPRAGVTPSYDAFKRQIAGDYPDLLVLDVAETAFDPRRFKLKPAGCHPSEYGNAIIAATVRNGLPATVASHEQR